MMSWRPVLLRTVIPLIAAVLGFVAGLAAGGMAEALIFPLALFATGHSHPLHVLDESFRSNPPGSLAIVMIGGYFTTAFLGAMAAYRTARRFSSRWSPPPRGSAASSLEAMGNFWNKCSRGRKALLVALPILTLALQTISVRERRAALQGATSQATREKSASLGDHGRVFYTTLEDRRRIFRWQFVSFLATFGTLAYLFHVFRFQDLVAQAFALRAGSDHDLPDRKDPKKPC